MDMYRELGERLKGLRHKTVVLYQGEVESVEGKTCTIHIDGLSIPDVRLRATTKEEDEELLITPAVGSMVIVGDLVGDLSQLVILAIDRAETITMHGGKLGGLVIAGNLTERLNAIERDLNALKQACSSWVPIKQDGGAALKASIASWAGQRLTETKIRDLENINIKQ